MTTGDLYARLAMCASTVAGAANDPDEVPAARVALSHWSRRPALEQSGRYAADWYETLQEGVEEREAFLDLLNDLAADDYWRHTDLLRDLLERRDDLEVMIAEDPSLEDPEWRIHEAAEDIKDLLTMMYRRLEREALDDSVVAAQFITRQLEAIDSEVLDDLLQTEPGYVARLREFVGDSDSFDVPGNEARTILIAQLIYDIRNSTTADGVVDWFDQPQDALGGLTPAQAIEARGVYSAGVALRRIARAARAQVAT